MQISPEGPLVTILSVLFPKRKKQFLMSWLILCVRNANVKTHGRIRFYQSAAAVQKQTKDFGIM